MTASAASIELDDTKFYNVTSDLNGYRIKQLKGMGKPIQN
jgi:hypothetical protein